MIEDKELFLYNLNENSQKINEIARHLKNYPNDLNAKDEISYYIMLRESALNTYENLS